MSTGVGGHMREIRGEDTRRFFGVAASILVASILVGCGGLGLLPSESEMKNTSFKSYQDVEAAYAQITPGRTKPNDLLLVGFDANDSPNMEVLSYLGVIERFIPRDSIRFDNLDPIVQQCIEARDRCTGFVFHPERLPPGTGAEFQGEQITPARAGRSILSRDARAPRVLQHLMEENPVSVIRTQDPHGCRIVRAQAGASRRRRFSCYVSHRLFSEFL